MLDTKEDIKRRQSLTTNAVNRIQAIFDNKKLTPETKITTFRTYIEPIFLYNSEIWIIKSSQAENTINVFQQRLLRTSVLNVK